MKKRILAMVLACMTAFGSAAADGAAAALAACAYIG